MDYYCLQHGRILSKDLTVTLEVINNIQKAALNCFKSIQNNNGIIEMDHPPALYCFKFIWSGLMIGILKSTGTTGYIISTGRCHGHIK